jgi:hypothetical protein
MWNSVKKSQYLDIDFIIHTEMNQKFITKIRFFNPQKLVFESGGPYHQINLEIKSVKGQGLEGVNLEVVDYETGDLHFYCSNAEVLSINKTNYSI